MRLSAIVRREGGLYVAWCPELDVASQGGNIEAALANLKEAVELYLDDDDASAPESALITTIDIEDGEVSGSVGA